ncbi:tail fiber domain-containing protein [Lewinella sp. W8]|uniref:tail fiber domain-containing protein n=1 Tax=Lewinella sp. W8 TaxID=2528208 RepID=UPI001068C7AF|nr:tail fiber domain-containing protein [Lewinella sp. W8]MTB52460.1 hypothetical protein [Lewinella sp. W8]
MQPLLNQFQRRLCLLTLLAMLAAGSLLAQAPNGFKFQAVARDADNNAMSAENIAVRISLLRDGAAGTVDYSERHEVTTSDLGVFDLHIGNGVQLSGDFTTIDWGAHPYYLKVDMDPDGGTAYVNMGASQLLSVPYALYAKESGDGGGGNPTDELQNLIYDPNTQTLTLTDGNSVTLQVGGGGTDDQTLSLSGTTLQIEDGNSVDLSSLQDGTEDADADPNNEIQTISLSGNQVSLSGGGGSITLPAGTVDTDDQTLSFSGTTLQIEDGNSVDLSSLRDGTEDADANPTNELQSLSLSGNNLSLSNGGGTVNLSGIGGSSLWTAAGSNIYRNTGNVGIGTTSPEMDFNLVGNMLLQSNIGAFHIGYPNNGNRWRVSTTNSGADLLFRSKVANSSTFNTRIAFRQTGEFQVGNIGTPEAWAHVLGNTNIGKPHMKLEEVGNDYARLELANTVSSSFWHVAGLPASSGASARLNMFYGTSSGGTDFMTITGDGRVGIYGSPSARLELYQRGQQVGTGLRFDDGTANQDWDITHGFSLRFHYGGSLRGFINANTGAYTQSSDESLKTAVAGIAPVMDKLRNLRIKTYRYKSADKPEMTIGLLAQEAQELFPELVAYSAADELYGVNYAGFSMVAIKAIQEQQETIDAQTEKIEALEARLARLEALLSPEKE